MFLFPHFLINFQYLILTLSIGPQTQFIRTFNADFCTSGSAKGSPSAKPINTLKYKQLHL